MKDRVYCVDCKYRLKPFYVCTIDGKNRQLIKGTVEVTGCTRGIRDV